MKIKRFLSFTLCVLMLLSMLAACGNDTDGGADTTTPEAIDTTEGETGGDETSPEETTPADTTEGTGAEGETTSKYPNEDVGVFVNVDLNSVTFKYLSETLKNYAGRIEEKTIYPFVDQYEASGVTDLSLNVFTQISQTPSDVWMTVADKYLQTNENGHSVDYKEEFGMCYAFLEELDMDYTGIWIDRCNEIGITPWINIRMNDCHNSGFSNPYFLRDDFFYEAQHLPSSYGYYQTCYDYADERVRQRMLDYIEEQMMRYDAHLELDFSREMYCFDYINNPDCHLIMTQFLRDVNKIVEAAEEKWGHDIKVLIRLMRDIEQNKAFGFDVEAMAEEELVDIVAVCPRWTSTDSDMPIAEWKERFPTLEIYASLEANAATTIPCEDKLVYAYSAQYLAQGADKIYLYNYYAYPQFPSNLPASLAKYYKACGSPSRLEKKEKRYVVLYQDICPAGFEPYKPLPALANDFSLDISTAPILETDKVKLIVGIHNSHTITADNLSVKLGGAKCEFVGKTTINGKDYTPDKTVLYEYTVDKSVLVDNITHTIEINTNETGMGVMYIELQVSPGR